MKTKYYKCNVCGKVIAIIKDSDGVIKCCNQPMEEIITKESDDKTIEKHMPTYVKSRTKIMVRVGNPLHPTTKEHRIEWIAILTNKGFKLRKLEPEEVPEVSFALEKDEQILEVSAYCNIHSLFTLVEEEKDDCGCFLEW